MNNPDTTEREYSSSRKPSRWRQPADTKHEISFIPLQTARSHRMFRGGFRPLLRYSATIAERAPGNAEMLSTWRY
jgi:hypothetical protein